MSDRELLENAAKAAGIEGQYFESDNPIHTGIYRAGHDYYWNPLISDSEALRLAVKTGAFGHPDFIRFLGDARFALQDHDDVAAYRRAIVRAAASLGEKM